MIPIITQILPHTTCSGRGEVMLRCEKASLTPNLQIQIESAFSILSKNPDTHIVFDTHKDPIADWIYIYAQAKQLDALLKGTLEPNISDLKNGILSSIYFAYEEGEMGDPEQTIRLLSENALESYLLSA
ncbi:MAG: hypothetical protein HG424_001875 [candidate division SR1 bacterium]|nr:hypothetical protein [candidate division SR1 bacterium]